MGETSQLLQAWRDGDDSVVDELVARHLPFVRQRVHDLLGPRLRERIESDDIVQESILEFLRYGPRFVPTNERQLHALLARIVRNTICDKSNWFMAIRRRMMDETRLATSQTLAADSSAGDPVQAAERAEARTRLRLAIELLDEDERELIVWHDIDQEPFAVIASRRNLGEEAARSAYRRAKGSLLDVMANLREREFDRLFA